MTRPWICTHCGYVEDAPPAGLTLRHCKREMRPTTVREYAALRQPGLPGVGSGAPGQSGAGRGRSNGREGTTT